jgi:3-oxoacyl-[acyl-carrier protein] reductase
MLKRKSGSIVAVSSGLSRHPGIGFCAHSSAKSALDAFIKSLALELGPEGLRINLIAPGLTLTDATSFLPEEAKKASANHTPMGRNALPEDIAGAILMMSSDFSKFVTGTYLPVSGGTQMI